MLSCFSKDNLALWRPSLVEAVDASASLIKSLTEMQCGELEAAALEALVGCMTTLTTDMAGHVTRAENLCEWAEKDGTNLWIGGSMLGLSFCWQDASALLAFTHSFQSDSMIAGKTRGCCWLHSDAILDGCRQDARAPMTSRS
eukprot:NODE_14378_length_1113_cov_1.937120.p2 GENE.NODE_14378_length_1113_cov_1.937120~~NODE_14378_length_1113_cov_1.937120.p2  ORF type:complete len:143 (-),score=26.08 NODE_14378_length_1113_cov_1.937120:187-615(-)